MCIYTLQLTRVAVSPHWHTPFICRHSFVLKYWPLCHSDLCSTILLRLINMDPVQFVTVESHFTFWIMSLPIQSYWRSAQPCVTHMWMCWTIKREINSKMYDRLGDWVIGTQSLAEAEILLDTLARRIWRVIGGDVSSDGDSVFDWYLLTGKDDSNKGGSWGKNLLFGIVVVSVLLLEVLVDCGRKRQPLCAEILCSLLFSFSSCCQCPTDEWQSPQLVKKPARYT